MSAGSSGQSRSGRGGRTKSGKPRPGTGGHGRRRLEGKGPTPPAHLRPGHPAQRRAAATARDEQAQGGKSRDAPAKDGQGRAAPGQGGLGRAAPAKSERGWDASAKGGPGRVTPAKGGPGRDASAQRGAAKRGPDRGGPRGGAATGSKGRGAVSRPAAGRTPAGDTHPGRGRETGAHSLGRARGAGDVPEVVAGRNAVLEALRAGVPATALYAGPRLDADDRVREAITLAAQAGIPMVEAGRPELDRLTGGSVHQGLALRIAPYDYAHPGDLTARAAAAGQVPLIVALDGVTDPRNLGAIARSAAAFGGHGVVIPARRSARVTAGAWKASAGALARVPVAQAPNLVRALTAYQGEGLFVVGLDASAAVSVSDLQIADGPLVLVIGSEGSGLSRLVAQRCDVLASIPIAAATESLNAGVAAGIALHEVARRRAGRS